MQNSTEFLKSVEIFSLLESDEIAIIEKALKTHDKEEGEIIFREGDPGNDLFIVKSGIVASSVKLPDGSDREVATFEPGNFFGEMSIFENAPRSATCYCSEKCSVVSLHDKDFFQIVEKNPDIAMKIMYRMLNIVTQRLRNTSEFLSDMVTWGDAASKRAITDEMTGAYNRRFLDDAIVTHFESAKKANSPLSVVMVDLDYFRDINDNYGHETGDSMIMEVVRVYNEILAEEDILARYGGDEFTILLPGRDSKAAFEIAEIVRREIESLDILEKFNGPVKRVTLSQGIASYPENAKDIKTLREQADQSLYRAKEEGRNRVICA